MYKVLVAALILTIGVGCSGMDPSRREAGALGGAGIGAGLGAIIGNQSGRAGEGVAIGAALGALSGALIGNEMDNQAESADRRDSQITRQQQLIEENRQLIEELKRSGADVRETDRGVVVNLPDVLFEFDSSRLTSEASDTAEEIASALRNVSSRRISIEGHTDSIGTLGYNQRLSEDRAQSVADELVSSGISRRRISVRGFGETEPIASNKTGSGRSRNRRVEVIIEN